MKFTERELFPHSQRAGLYVGNAAEVARAACELDGKEIAPVAPAAELCRDAGERVVGMQ